MPICNLTEEEIIDRLRSEDYPKRTHAQMMLYKDDDVNRSVKGYVRNNSGSKLQAQEVFDYAFLQFDARVRDKRYPSAERADNNWRKMLASIGYRAWDFKSYGQKELPPLDRWLDDYDPVGPVQESDFDIDLESVLDLVSRCGKNCRFIFEKEIEGFNLEEIAGLLNISHENSRKQKSNCMKELSNRS